VFGILHRCMHLIEEISSYEKALLLVFNQTSSITSRSVPVTGLRTTTYLGYLIFDPADLS
jgi:hypothetical protein